MKEKKNSFEAAPAALAICLALAVLMYAGGIQSVRDQLIIERDTVDLVLIRSATNITRGGMLYYYGLDPTRIIKTLHSPPGDTMYIEARGDTVYRILPEAR